MITFTQYVLPKGEPRSLMIERPPDVEFKARKIVESGFTFEAEILKDGLVSLTIADPALQEDVAIRLTPNGPEVPEAVDTLVMEFDIETALKYRKDTL